jgi:hypothetical protein
MTASGARELLRLIFLPALLAVAGGCETSGSGDGLGVGASQFQDVVVPAGLRLQDAAHQSYSREESGWRHGQFVYSGAMAIEEAMGYVRQRMPQHNWTIVADEADEQRALLRFERGIYSAEYTFQRRDGSTQMVVAYRTDYTRR